MNNKLLHANPFPATGAAALFVLVAALSRAPAAGEQPKTNGTVNALSENEATLRDPFWPVGYRPVRVINIATNQPQAELTGEPDWEMAKKKVVVQGVSSRADNVFYAVINGEVKSEGDTVSVTLGNMTYRWRIESISPPNNVKMAKLIEQ